MVLTAGKCLHKQNAPLLFYGKITETGLVTQMTSLYSHSEHKSISLDNWTIA